MKRIGLLVVVLLLAHGPSLQAGGDNCNPPFGYTWQCGATCGSPGTCTQAEPTHICMLTAEGWGCFDDPDDPCCHSAGGF